MLYNSTSAHSSLSAWEFGKPHTSAVAATEAVLLGASRALCSSALAPLRARDVMLESARMGGNSREFSGGVFTGSQSLGGISQ